MKKLQRGFTLIELLVVIAVLGIMASGVLVAINPLERLAQTRDAQRRINISQLANALQTYYVIHATSIPPFPPVGNPAGYNWITALVNDGDLKSVIPAVSNNPSTNCDGGVYFQNGYCYYIDPSNNAYTMIQLESQKEKNKCSAGTYPYYVWDSGRGKIGVVCVNHSAWCLAGGCTFLP